MAFASFDGKRGGAPMADINMVPLIDVMLVLLVIFIVTAPLLTHAVRLDLPRATAQATLLKPEKVELAIDASGQRFWNGQALSRAQARQRMAEASQRAPQPELHLRADQAVPYREVALSLADAANAGLQKVGFISEPERP
jgi:biopolymer transport protein ExbD